MVQICRVARVLLAAGACLIVAGCRSPDHNDATDRQPTSVTTQPEHSTSTSSPSKPSDTAGPLPDVGLGTAAPLPDSMVDNSSAAGEGADNSRCYVCHLNFQFEELAQTHAAAGIGCADCHGPSDAHIADESWSWGGKGTPPDRMYPRQTINAGCAECHEIAGLPAQFHESVQRNLNRTDTVCTDCHGKHRLPTRKVKWK